MVNVKFNKWREVVMMLEGEKCWLVMVGKKEGLKYASTSHNNGYETGVYAFRKLRK